MQKSIFAAGPSRSGTTAKPYIVCDMCRCVTPLFRGDVRFCNPTNAARFVYNRGFREKPSVGVLLVAGFTISDGVRPMTHSKSRRRFLKNAALGVAAVPFFVPHGVMAADGSPGANDKVGIGYIGVGRRGGQLFGIPKDAEIRATSDLYFDRAKKVAAKLKVSPRLRRLPQDARPERDRRGGHRHAGPLARAAVRPRLPGGQGRLLRKADEPHRRRRPQKWSTRQGSTSGSARLEPSNEVS